MLGDFMSSLRNILLDCIQVIQLLHSFAHFCIFSRLWSINEQIKLGVSGDGQTSTSRKTIRISLFSLSSLVSDLVPRLQLREKVS